MAESEKDLHEHQDERAYDFQIKELEDLQTKFEEGIEKRKTQIDGQVEYYKAKIDEIDAYLDNSRQLYEDACAMIDNDTGELYSNLWSYTYQYTTQTKAEFDHLWTSAQEAIQKYIGDNNSLLSTMEWVQLEIYNTETQIGELDGQIDEVQVSIDELDNQIDELDNQIEDLDDQIEDLDDQISILQDSIDDVSDSVDTQSGKVSDLGSSWSGATTEVSKYIDELNKIPDTTPASSKIPSSHTNDNVIFTGIPSNARWYFDYYKNGARKRAWSSAEDRSTAASDIITEIQRQTGQYRSDVYGGMKHFASGTRHSPTEFISQEKGLEAVFAKNPNGSGMYTLTTPDSQVFDSKRTDNLYDFSGDPEEFISKLADKGLSLLSGDELSNLGWGRSIDVSQLFSGLFNSPDFIKNLTGLSGTTYNNDNNASNDVYSCVVNLNMQGVADQTTAQAIIKAKRDIKDEMLKELTRLGERNRRMKR